MSRLIFVPQYPSELRYQYFFYREFPKNLKKYFDEVVVLGRDFIIQNGTIRSDYGLFSSLELSVKLEFEQVKEYLSIDIKNDDVLLLMDLSYPGFFSNIFYHKPMENCFVYCHATSKNHFDLFEKVRYSKYPCEIAHSELFKKVFVGSHYHKNKLKWRNIEVVGLPFPPFETYREKKEFEIISVSRPNNQKISKSIEDKIEKEISKIVRKNVSDWEEYYKFLSSGKVLLITTNEETFGYSAMEAIMNGTIVIAPNNFSYPELLPKEFLYDDYNDLCLKLIASLNGDLKPPEKLLCDDLCENFYENIVKIMLN